jgi:hypothetical protein
MVPMKVSSPSPSSGRARLCYPKKERRMGTRERQRRCGTIGRVSIAVAALLVACLAGCASDRVPEPVRAALDAAPYVGVFTGQFVDGKPLYRFPTIEVVGSRRGSGQP